MKRLLVLAVILFVGGMLLLFGSGTKGEGKEALRDIEDVMREVYGGYEIENGWRELNVEEYTVMEAIFDVPRQVVFVDYQRIAEALRKRGWTVEAMEDTIVGTRDGERVFINPVIGNNTLSVTVEIRRSSS